MAFSFSNGSGGGRRRFHGTSALSEMNVVPLVDVVLVLLIIFMLTAHAMEFGLEVEVPKVRQNEKSVQDLPVITIDRQGNFYLNEKEANINSLAEDVRSRFGKQVAAVYVRADKGTVWEPIAHVISELTVAKIAVRMVTQPADDVTSGAAGKKRK